MTSSRLTFIGAGNMAKAILSGLIAKQYPTTCLRVCSPVEDELDWIEQQWGLATNTDNKAFIADSDAVILCVKPQVMLPVCEQLRESIQQYRPLTISIAAGITINQLETALTKPIATMNAKTEPTNGSNAGHQSSPLPIVRCMPNTPAQVHLGATGLFANDHVSEAQQLLVKSLFEAVGIALWVGQEADLHGVTALSGSGPAYCFWFLDAMENAATGLGLPAELSRQLAIQTMLGAAALAAQSSASPNQLKLKVMSPGGTTEKAIARFEQEGLAASVALAMKDAWERSHELAGDSLPDPESPLS